MFRKNWKLFIFMALLASGGTIYVIDQPAHAAFIEGTLVQAADTNPITPDHTKMIAKLKNGVQVKVRNFYRVNPVPGKKIKIEKRTRTITGYNEYKFIEYIE